MIFAGAAAVGETLPDPYSLMVAGFAEAYPEADPPLVLIDAAPAVLDGVNRGCFAMREAIGDTPWQDLLRPKEGQPIRGRRCCARTVQARWRPSHPC